jgi:hypothetical protein
LTNRWGYVIIAPQSTNEENIMASKMQPFEFQWKETVIKNITVPVEDIVGCEVWYQPMDASGEIIERDGKLFIEWNDAPDTELDTPLGREIIKECKIF